MGREWEGALLSSSWSLMGGEYEVALVASSDSLIAAQCVLFWCIKRIESTPHFYACYMYSDMCCCMWDSYWFTCMAGCFTTWPYICGMCLMPYVTQCTAKKLTLHFHAMERFISFHLRFLVMKRIVFAFSFHFYYGFLFSRFCSPVSFRAFCTCASNMYSLH